ncbi:hypothetical protein [Actinomyces gerencseriae]|uniref:hypothetical protein n=1 Tax=Actinomyces gerencseriae TaxID=52769 RepID=UPI0028EC8925|nr:hypothetical protein [Actinomyces gerencseriae]
MCDSMRSTLGTSMEPPPFPQFSELRQQISDHEIVGAFRSGWQADYPSKGASSAVPTRRTGTRKTPNSRAAFDDLLARDASCQGVRPPYPAPSTAGGYRNSRPDVVEVRITPTVYIGFRGAGILSQNRRHVTPRPLPGWARRRRGCP